MVSPRVPETDHGIVGEQIVSIFDELQRSQRDSGYLATQEIIKSGIQGGQVLEVGPGPGYLGLEWLKRVPQATLTGLDISPDMIAMARRNAQAYGLDGRVSYRQGNGSSMPFEEGTFDAVFTNGSLHEWSDPRKTFNEIGRVLKPGGRFFISDLRRDMSWLARSFMWWTCKPASIRPGLLTSIAAAYTPEEIQALVSGTRLQNCTVRANPFGLIVCGLIMG